jgi:hypothetical protein
MKINIAIVMCIACRSDYLAAVMYYGSDGH